MFPVERLQFLISAVAPINGIDIGDPANKATWIPRFVNATPAQQTAAAGVITAFDVTVPFVVPLLTLFNAIAALTPAQKGLIWTDFNSGAPPKWALDAGPNAAALACLHLMGASATLPAADILQAKELAVAMYVSDNPNYLVHPAFDATINISGRQ